MLSPFTLFTLPSLLFLVALSHSPLPTLLLRCSHPSQLVRRGSWQNQVLFYSEPIFTILFFVEFALKATAMGLFGDASYFDDTWNWLDFVVVFFGIFSAFATAAGVGGLRTVRVLRPLKSLKSFPTLAEIVTVLMMTLQQMRDIMILVLFLFLMLGIAGTSLSLSCNFFPIGTAFRSLCNAQRLHREGAAVAS
jgi:hypothetical protein